MLLGCPTRLCKRHETTAERLPNAAPAPLRDGCDRPAPRSGPPPTPAAQVPQCTHDKTNFSRNTPPQHPESRRTHGSVRLSTAGKGYADCSVPRHPLQNNSPEIRANGVCSAPQNKNTRRKCAETGENRDWKGCLSTYENQEQFGPCWSSLASRGESYLSGCRGRCVPLQPC